MFTESLSRSSAEFAPVLIRIINLKFIESALDAVKVFIVSEIKKHSD